VNVKSWITYEGERKNYENMRDECHGKMHDMRDKYVYIERRKKPENFKQKNEKGDFSNFYANFVLRSCAGALIKKIIGFSSYMKKFRRDRLQRHSD
jgi:hypothetical protein